MSTICASTTRLCVRQRSLTNPCHFRDLNSGISINANNALVSTIGDLCDHQRVSTSNIAALHNNDCPFRANEIKPRKAAHFAALGVMPARIPIIGEAFVIYSGYRFVLLTHLCYSRRN